MPVCLVRPLDGGRSLIVALGASICAVACNPALNWRTWRAEGTRLTAMLPCKPSAYARSLPIAGADVTLHLHACSTDATTWAVSHADLVDPARIDPALRALLAAAGANVGATPAIVAPWSPAGATPAAAAGRARIDGRLPDGKATTVHVGVFAFGTQVFQATVVGRAPEGEALSTFFDGLRFQP